MKLPLSRLARRIVPRRWLRAERLEKRLRAELEPKVLAGPFAGMRYLDRSYSSAYWPKILGTYELELHPTLETLLNRRFDRVLVVGAAEGYYAVGFALRVPEARIVAWEAAPDARAAVAELAEINECRERIDLRELCDGVELERFCAGAESVLVVMDTDGGEAILLDPRIVPSLRETTIVVEVHDCFVAGLTANLKARFASTHDIAELRACRRRREEAPPLALSRVFDGALEQLLSERRPAGNEWLVMTRRGEI